MKNSAKWFTDVLSPYERHQHGLKKTLVRTKTAFQTLALVDTHAFGRCLILDGEIQSAQRDEYIYHESLVHPALVSQRHPRDVLVLGGGEGATLREVLRYPSVRRIVMVDIDGKAVSFCRQYLRSWHQGSFTDPRVVLRIGDAGKFIRETHEQFDIIISDLPTPSGRGGPLARLYSAGFFRHVARRLKTGGCMVTQSGSGSPIQFQFHAALYRRLKSVFKHVRPYYAFVPSFDVPWSFLLASQGAEAGRLTGADVNRRLGTAGKQLRFYDGETHDGLFRIPRYARTMLT